MRQNARQQIAQLVQTYNAIPKEERPLLTEANVLHQFITPLLSALGWPIDHPARCKYELSTQTGRPGLVPAPLPATDPPPANACAMNCMRLSPICIAFLAPTSPTF
jgi:hypothetical protein